MRTKISQTEARRLRKRVHALEFQISEAKRQYRPYMNGTSIASASLSGFSAVTAIRTAERLGYGIRVELNGDAANFIAIDPRSTP